MDFSWTKEQLDYKQKVIEFAKANLDEQIAERDQNCVFSREAWEKCAAFGLLGLSVPKADGGLFEEVEFLTATLAMESLGYACRDNGLPFGLNAQMWTVQYPIVQFGSEAQKQKFLPHLIGGKWIGCHALTESEAGSDVYNMQTRAKKVEGGYILNGSKQYVTFAPIADVVLVFANVNPEIGTFGITGFLVEKGMKGFTNGENKVKMGLRTVPFGDLIFEDCFVPEENRLSTEGSGWGITMHSLEYDRCNILAGQLGAMQYQLEQTIAYVKKRKQFGKPVAQFQAVSNRIANMKLRLETSRLLLYKLAWLNQNGKPATLESAMLKLLLSESFVESSMDAIRNHGGHGYITENEIERNMRDAIGSVIYAGTSDIQRNIISDYILDL
jgi:alkylation response protein AidB-like acyl-CoA dehydrogenase